MEPIVHETLGVPYQSMLVKFTVERGFVNAPAGQIEIVTGRGGGDCGYAFKVGGKYLVYASKTASSHLSTGICSRTRPVADAQDDFRYLTTMATNRGGGRVYGRLNEWKRDPAEERAVDYGPVEGITVTFRGTTFTRDVVTDADGRFELTKLPVGKGTLTAVFPFGYDPSTFEQEIELRDLRACSQVDFSIHQVARASGLVVDASGRPLAGIAVDAVAAELAGFDPSPYQRPVKTDERGMFEFRDLPPGVYVFGVNLTKPPYGHREGKPIFLPGTRIASEATIIDLNAGDRKEVGVLRLGDR